MSEATTTSNRVGSREFLVPDLGEGLEEATVVEWYVAVGDTVGLNAPLCVLETAKAMVDIPSPFAGTVVERRGEAGETLKVGSLLVSIQVSGAAEPKAPTRETLANATPAGSVGRRTPTLVGYGVDEESQDRPTRRRRLAVPRAAPTPPAAPSTPATPAPALEAAGLNGSPVRSSDRPLAKPPVRRLARRLGVDLAALAPGSGLGGIVTRLDVLAAANSQGRGQDQAQDAHPAPEPQQPRQIATVNDVGTYPDEATTIPVRGIRARIAERMTLSRARIPDATCSVTVDCTRLLEVRGRLNAAAERAGGSPVVTPFALIARLLVQALTTHPELNATYLVDGPAIRRYKAVHLGVGTATDRGLLVPVVRDAQRLTTLQLAEEITRLAVAARSGRATPAELTGSTFTVSNFGALGLDEGIPVVNYPEAAILGVGSVKPRPVVVDGAVVARRTATLTCAFDHRVADGAEAGTFMRELAALVEEPDLALLKA